MQFLFFLLRFSITAEHFLAVESLPEYTALFFSYLLSQHSTDQSGKESYTLRIRMADLRMLDGL